MDNLAAVDALAFSAPRQLAPHRIVATALGKLAVSAPAARPAHVRYLDTFDRRLRRAGFVLEHLTLPGETGLRYREFGQPRLLVDAPGAALPAFAHDIAHSRLRAMLQSLIDVRRLLVIAESRGRFGVARGRDAEDKTVLMVERFTASRGPTRFTIRPLRGYECVARRAIRRTRKLEGVVSDDGEPLLAAHDGPDAAFGGVPAPVRADPDPGERSDVACRRVLARLEAVLEVNAPGVLADLDPECLHDFRVAVRRARSLLGEMRRVFPPVVTRRLRADFGWLGRCTGPLRDLDVHLIEFGVADDDDDEAGQAAASAALRIYLEALRERERRALCRVLRSARYRRARAASRKFLAHEAPARPRSENALVSIGALSAGRILKVYRRTLTEGRAIEDASPAEALHDLRKTCKRLRYLLEFFRDVHRAKPVERTIARLKYLQDNLGAYQDVQIQRTVLEEFREHAQTSLDAAAVAAVDARCAALAERERRTRTEFAARFASYDSKRAHQAFTASLRRKRTGEPVVTGGQAGSDWQIGADRWAGSIGGPVVSGFDA
ncbi:MAG: CHAD domain-containing protein [Thiotrichales bacterium]|nr:CHAD domain-containing protein [Thiotrichales bacterium]